MGVSATVYSFHETLWDEFLWICSNSLRIFPPSLSKQVKTYPAACFFSSLFWWRQSTPSAQSFKILSFKRLAHGAEWFYSAQLMKICWEKSKKKKSSIFIPFIKPWQDFLQHERGIGKKKKNNKACYFPKRWNWTINERRQKTTERGRRWSTDGHRLKKKRYVTHPILCALSCMLRMSR